ncbi:alpha/beta hydrolase [Kitasatospora sp. NPDC056446]|uniref:alpha/beta hydrolase n=1 Tax=Kitasatospora sp. NPDC056446 TaxID=3345819 RepID=UPI003690A1F9
MQPCAFWTSSAGEPATVVDDDVDAPIVRNQWDPRTTPTMAQGMRRAPHGSRMVTVAGGEGRGVVVNGPSCADTAVTRHLTTGRLPARDLTCGGRVPQAWRSPAGAQGGPAGLRAAWGRRVSGSSGAAGAPAGAGGAQAGCRSRRSGRVRSGRRRSCPGGR